MVAYVAKTKEKLRDKTSNKDPRYPEGIKDFEVPQSFILQPEVNNNVN